MYLLVHCNRPSRLINCQVLVEAAQQLPDGRVRQRGLVVSEKMIGEEIWREAAQRAVSEELGSVLQGQHQMGGM